MTQVFRTENDSNKQLLALKPLPDQDNTLVKEGKSNAITINTPFTVIPGLPELSSILKRLDKVTNQDLGFTFKASTEMQENSQNTQDLLIKLDYVGFGVMSSKFNVQYSPFSVKVESGKSDPEPHWGCSASVLSSPIGLVHERAGMKGTFSDCDNTRSFNAAPEFSYQKSSTFKPLSTATGGYFFGDAATLRIPSSLLPALDRLKTASPSLEEWEMIAEHIAPSIPQIQIGRLIEHGIEIAQKLIKPIKITTEPAKKDALINSTEGEPLNETISAQKSLSKVSKINQSLLTDSVTERKEKQQNIRLIVPSIEEKASYIIQKNDTLSEIAEKTGHPWQQIYSLNRVELRNNPDLIQPGQELRLPENYSHAELMRHPVVQSQIAENLKKQAEVFTASSR